MVGIETFGSEEGALLALLNSSPLAIVAMDAEGNATIWNPAAERLFGWNAGEVLGGPLPCVPPDDRNSFQSTLVSVLEGKELDGLEIECVHSDGSRMDVSLSLTPRRDTSGRIVGAVGVIADVTARKQAERDLRETDEMLSAIVAASPLSIVTTNVEGQITSWNPAAESMFGWSTDEVLGKELPFVLPADRDAMAALRARVLAGEMVLDREGTRVCRDGSTLHVSFSLAPLRDASGSVVGIIGLQTDISVRKHVDAEVAERNAELLAMHEALARETAEFNKQLRRSARDVELMLEREKDVRRTLSAVVTASPVAIIAVDAERRVTMWNPAAERIFGWSAEEVFLGQLPFFSPGNEDEARELENRVLSGEMISDHEALRMRRDGTPIDVSVSLAPLRSDGDVVGYVEVSSEITERLRAERELRAAEERYRCLVEQIPAIVYLDVADTYATTLYVSPQVEALLGITPDEWIRSSLEEWLEWVHPDDRGRARDAVLAAVEGARRVDTEYRMVGRDGTIRWFHDQGQVLPATDDGPGLMHGVMLDITDQKEAELALAQTSSGGP